ncbi:MAG TPA: acyl carrier protein [Steroidobacteraceae bacterium]|nr:acyl carrier protein [Steroidobacteraceae bacterium]
MPAMEKPEIYAWVSRHLTEMFEIAPERITPEARLYQDLDIDSIDAVDLMVKLNELTGKRVMPESFRSVRTVADVVDVIYGLVN